MVSSCMNPFQKGRILQVEDTNMVIPVFKSSIGDRDFLKHNISHFNYQTFCGINNDTMTLR